MASARRFPTVLVAANGLSGDACEMGHRPPTNPLVTHRRGPIPVDLPSGSGAWRSALAPAEGDG